MNNRWPKTVQAPWQPCKYELHICTGVQFYHNNVVANDIPKIIAQLKSTLLLIKPRQIWWTQKRSSLAHHHTFPNHRDSSSQGFMRDSFWIRHGSNSCIMNCNAAVISWITKLFLLFTSIVTTFLLQCLWSLL